MVILFSADYYFENGIPITGFPMYVKRVTTALAQLGHMPIIVACGKRNQHYFEDGVEIYFVRCQVGLTKVKSWTLLKEALYRSKLINQKIREIARTRNIDIIQFTSIQGTGFFYYGKIPAVMRLSSYAKIYYATYQTFSRAEVGILTCMERLSAMRCNAVFAPSKIIADNFARDIGRPVSVIETPFINDVIEYDERIYEEILQGKKYVLFFGRLAPEKGIFVIADIIHEFLKTHSEYSIVCCGPNESFINGKHAVNVLKESAGEYEERFIYLNALPHEQLYPIIQKADFVILPSLLENLSNACIEAMHFGQVVIGTDGASYEQLIDDGISGLLCKPNDGDSLLKKMNEAAAMSETKKRKMGELAKKRIDRLAPEVVVRKLLRYYQYVIENVNK